MSITRENLAKKLCEHFLPKPYKWDNITEEERDSWFLLADKLLADDSEPPALKVWPGLEGEGLERVRKVYNRACDVAKQGDDVYRFAWTAAAAHLWRALVASLPVWDRTGCIAVGAALVTRTALAALADPYDGGTK